VTLRVLVPSTLGRGVRLSSVAAFLPPRVVTNAELAALGAPLTPDEIVRLCGIHERRWAAPGVATSDLAVQACSAALAGAGVAPREIDRLILATVSPDHLSPSAACVAQAALGLGDAPAYDLTASCSGFLYALDAAARAVLTGDRHVLACAADVRSAFLDLTDRATCALFGDGAGAAVVSPGAPGAGLLAVGLLADGSGAKSVYVPAGGSREPATAATVAARRHFIRMEEGPQVYLTAVEGMLSTAEGLLSALGLTFDDIDLVVPHQPNRRILDRLARLAKLPEGRLFVNVEKIGNVSGATCAIALDEALRTGRAKAGMRVLLLAAGAGYTAGAALLAVDEALVRASRPGG
jgi:3-oxoacyl-[acyl-carrier-protein] synthase-3